MRKTVLAVVIGLLAFSANWAAAAGTQIEVQVLDEGQPVVGAHVAVFLSCDRVEGTTGEEGRAVLESACQGGFYWLEIDGRRVDTLYQVAPEIRVIDLAEVTFIVWQGGR